MLPSLRSRYGYKKKHERDILIPNPYHADACDQQRPFFILMQITRHCAELSFKPALSAICDFGHIQTGL
jgi:hypothetical protein